MENKPPRILLAFFRWYCNPEYLEEIEGDLLERYENNVHQSGIKKAKLLFIKDVIQLFRPTIIGNIYHLLLKNSTVMTIQNKRLLLIMSGVPVLLLIPLIAIQFTNEVDWKIFDFIIMGMLLLGTGLLCELVLRKFKTAQARLLVCAFVLFAFFLIWAELAVGIFGSAFAGS